MDNYLENPLVSAWPQKRPKGIKTADIKRMKREGYSTAAICNKLNVSPATVSYHLAKKRKPKADNVADVRSSVNSEELNGFEAELFGTVIKLDRVPASIERIGNRIVIK